MRDPFAWRFGSVDPRLVARRLARREFLGGAAAVAGLGGSPRRARAATGAWGAAPDAATQALMLGAGVKAESMLEVFMYGGMPAFESFYAVPEYGMPGDPQFPNEQFWLFADSHEDVFSARCGVAQADWLMPWATDYLGKTVNLGPMVMPLRDRPDLLARMRVMVHRHDLEPHEGAIPFALSGFGLGSSRMFGLGTAVQHHFRDTDTTGRITPFSYVLYPDSEVSKDNLRAASAVGLHPGSMRPLDLRMTAESDLAAQLSRMSVGENRAQFDALVSLLSARTVDRYSKSGVAIRSSALEDYQFSVEAVQNADALLELLPEDVLAALGNEECGQTAEVDRTAMGLKVAAHLLTHPSSAARYVNVVDGGMIPAAGGGGYDLHSDHLYTGTRNLTAMLRALASHVNEPGEGDPGKIDLDKTLIVLNTEFGRTPYVQALSGSGTNHHPYGYVTIWIGGPIREEQAGILGAIGPDAWSDYYVTPTEARAAALVAMGIWPFSQEGFAIGDLRDHVYELDGLMWLKEFVLGVRS